MKSKYKKTQKKESKTGKTKEIRKTRSEKSDSKYQFSEAWEVFKAYLKARGDRITQTRRIVLERALKRTDHFQADDLAADLSRGSDRVSRGTVYRALRLLVTAGLVREIRDTDAHAHFESVFDREHHEHMVCDSCGEFIEFVDAGLAKRIDQACSKQQFNQRTHRVVVFGLCKNCKS